jgi:hypothetical protein
MTGQTDVRGKRDFLFLLPLLLFLMLMGARASQASEACLQRRAVKRVVKLTNERGCAGALAKVRGYHEAGDRGGGRFAWKPAGAFASSDGGTVFAARGGGWWVRQRRREDVANVRWFGARGDGADVPRKNARAFNEAIASLEDGGVVEVPGPATYIVGGSRSRIMMAEGITLRGTGGERVAELKGPKRGASRMIYIGEDVQGTAVENLKMDLRSRKDYGTALFKKGGGCVVRGNIFYDSTLYLEESDPAYTGDENWTRMAILNRGSELQVQDNIFRGVQAKVAGGKGRMTGIDVTNNEFTTRRPTRSVSSPRQTAPSSRTRVFETTTCTISSETAFTLAATRGRAKGRKCVSMMST